ncbi:MAG: hypothetical protein JXR78_15640 [Victivallales bacterium]|nr:hypothetical protein [Victivallales bacterium]
MSVWLYDEFNWPSGKCKGKVIRQNSDFAAKKLVAFADSNFMGKETLDNFDMEYYWSEISIPIYADILNPEAVNCFIQLTHNVYYEHFSSYFGSTIKGMFSDEPSFEYPMLQAVSGSVLELPYYRGLETDYQGATGRKLTDDLEQHLRGNCPSHLWHVYNKLMGRRLCEVFFKKCRDWCDKHNILFTGHLLKEERPEHAIHACGLPIEAIRAFSLPGLDEIYTHTTFDSVEWGSFKLLESAVNGECHGAMVELFALGPADMSMTKMRQMIYIAALHGASHFVTAVSPLDARGNIDKPYYYNPVSPAQPWFEHIGILNDSAAEIVKLTMKPSSAQIALRYPQYLYCEKWNQREHLCFNVDYNILLRELIRFQWQFKLIDAEENVGEKFQVVLELNGNGVRDECSGKNFDDVNGLLKYLEENLSRPACITDNDGNVTENLLFKSFDDGSAAVLNLSDKVIDDIRFGAEPVELLPYEATILPRAKSSVQNEDCLYLDRQLFNPVLNGANYLRCIVDRKYETSIYLNDDLELRFALRQYRGKVEAELDGLRIDADFICDSLPDGFNDLYFMTQPIRLRRGCHILRVPDNTMDFPYLPAAIAVGNFAVAKDKTLSLLPDNPVEVSNFFDLALREYVGTVSFKKNIRLSGYNHICGNYRDMVAELFINGRSIGARTWAPFMWNVKDYFGMNVELELKIFTSIGPMFADYPEHMSNRTPSWLKDFWPKIHQ